MNNKLVQFYASYRNKMTSSVIIILSFFHAMIEEEKWVKTKTSVKQLHFLHWMSGECQKLEREKTFENAEKLNRFHPFLKVQIYSNYYSQASKN